MNKIIKNTIIAFQALLLLSAFNAPLMAQSINVDNIKIKVGTGYYISTAGSMQLQNSGAIDNSGTLKIGSNWTNNANGLINASAGTVELNGATQQTIGGSAVTIFNNLIINNSNGITLAGNIIVNGTLTFTNGKITTGANYVILGNAATVTGAGAGMYVNGNLRRFISATANAVVNFQIGDATNYTPVQLTFVGTPSGASSIDAATSVAAPPLASGISQTQYVNRQWNLTNNGVTGFTSYSAIFNFAALDIIGGANTANFIVANFNAPNWSLPTVGAKTSTSTEITGATSFGTFALGVANNITWYLDADNDGYYVSTTQSVNSPGAGYTSILPANGLGDCNDNDANVYALPTAPTITAGSATTFCSGGSVTLSGNNGGTWSSGGTQATISVTTSGTYSVTTTNSCGSTTSNSIEVTVTPITVNTTTIAACDSYTWPVNGQTYTTSGTHTVNSDATAFYNSLSGLTSAVASSGYTLSATETFESLSQGFISNLTGNFGPSSPTWQASAPSGLYPFVLDGSMTLSTNAGGEPLTISFSPGVTSVGANFFITNDALNIVSGTITLTLSDGSTEFFEVNSANGFGGFVSYNAYITGITIATSNDFVTMDNLVVSTGTIIPSCVSEVLNLTIHPLPAATISASGATTFCNGGNVILTSSAATGNVWSNGATTQAITVSTAGVYGVTVTDGNNCTAASLATVVSVNPLPTATISANGPTTFCDGGAVILSTTIQQYASSVLNFSTEYSTSDWSANQALGAPDVYPAYGDFINAWAGSNPDGNGREYLELGFTNPAPIDFIDVFETNAPGAVDTVYVKNPTTGLFEIVYTATAAAAPAVARILHITFPETSFNVSEIRIALNSGAVLDYNEIDAVSIGIANPNTYLWSNGETTDAIIASTAGDYSLTVTNVNGCSATSTPTSVVVNPLPATPTISANGATTFCDGENVILTSSSATGNVWSNGATTQAITASTAGDYGVTVTNGNSCSASSNATTVVVNPLPVTPTISASGATTFCAGGNVILTSSSATGNVWSNGATTQAITASTAGDYSVTVTYGNGCSVTSNATTVTVNPLPVTPTITASGATTFCDGGSVVLTSSAATGNVWSNGATTQAITASTAGDYGVTVTDGNGCTAQSSLTSVSVTPTVTPSLSITTANTTVCQNASTVFTATATNGGSSPSYQWKVNGVNAGSNSASFTTTTLTNGQTVTCILTSNANCANPTAANSNAITMVVNNCSGVANTQLTTAFCGVQNLALNAAIACNAVVGATNYDFEFTNLTTNVIGVKTVTSSSVSLISVTPAFQYGTQYNVRVRAKVAGVYGNYSTICVIGTVCNPSICGVPLTKLRTSDCGKLNLSPLTGQIIANAVTAASQYQFEFRNISTNAVYATKLQTSNALALNTVTPALQYNTQYNVKVRAYIGGIAGTYGDNCVIGFIADPAVSGVPNTQLSTALCGVTNLALTGSITCIAVSNAGSYEWEFKNQANTTVVATKTTTSTSLTLSTVTGLQWNTQYNVRVRAYIGTVAGTYNVSCLIGLIPDPAIGGVPSTKIRTSDCGKLNFGLGGFILADAVSGANQYEFEVRDVNTNAFIANRIQATNGLTFSTVPALTWGTQYKISVRARISTTWGTFGTPCTIGFICNPAICGVPTTNLRTSDCGKLNFNFSTGLVVANTVNGATLYEFQITDLTTNAVSVQSRTTMNLVFNTVVPALQNNRQYSIKVRATISGVVGTYGTACTIGFVSGSREELEVEEMNAEEILNENIFTVNVYPNPFNQQATMFIQSSNNNKAQVQIFDMVGNLVWNEQVNTNTNVTIGNDFATGTYIVKVLNESGEQAIHRMIKTN